MGGLKIKKTFIFYVQACGIVIAKVKVTLTGHLLHGLTFPGHVYTITFLQNRLEI